VNVVSKIRINWDKAAKLAVKLSYLATKYTEMSRAELMGFIEAVQARNDIALMEHLYWLLRSLDAADKARTDPEVAEVMKIVREELFA
jgi:hypothetical protein